MAIFKGAGVAIVTPMKENGEINYEVLGALIEDQIANHTDAIIICGTSGEAPTLEDDEHLEAIRYTVEKTALRRRRAGSLSLPVRDPTIPLTRS